MDNIYSSFTAHPSLQLISLTSPFRRIYAALRSSCFSLDQSRILLSGNGLTLPKQQILDSSKLKKFADDNYNFDENGRKLSKRPENTEGKGEIARYEQFLLFPQCFQKTCTADT